MTFISNLFYYSHYIVCFLRYEFNIYIFSFWNFFSEWSVIYVGIFISLLLAGSICGIFFLNFKKQKPRNNKSNSRSSRKSSRYTRLEQNDQNFELRSKFFLKKNARNGIFHLWGWLMKLFNWPEVFSVFMLWYVSYYVSQWQLASLKSNLLRKQHWTRISCQHLNC